MGYRTYFNNTVLFLLCLVVGALILISLLNSKSGQNGSTQLRYSDSHGSYLIPPDAELVGLSQTELVRIYWRYINNLQVLCKNQTRLGLFKDGGKETCVDNDLIPKAPCLVYSFGSAFIFDFENMVTHAFGCDIITFDPTTLVTDQNKDAIPKEVNFQLIGLAGIDHVNENKWTMATFGTIIKMLNHTQRPIDIVKIDIEGWEFSALQQAIDAGTLQWVKQLMIEIHFAELAFLKDHKPKLRVLRGLYEQGFRIFMRDRNTVSILPMISDYNTHYTPFVEVSMINIKYRQNV